MKTRKMIILILVLMLLGATTVPALAAPPPPDKFGCTKIQDGTLLYSAGHNLGGQPLTLGYDAWGYNYQAHMFNGSYANAYLGGMVFQLTPGMTLLIWRRILLRNPTGHGRIEMFN